MTEVETYFDILKDLYNLGDLFDELGAGVKALSDDELTTREVMRWDLALFMLYIAACNGYLNEAQEKALYLVFEGQYDTDEFEGLMNSMNTPSPSDSLSFTPFLLVDKYAESIINIYEFFGNLMATLCENQIAKERCDNYINTMRTMATNADNSDNEEDKEMADMKETSMSIEQAPRTTFRKLSDFVSVCDDDNTIIRFNNEWTFELPDGFTYKVDSDFDGGMPDYIYQVPLAVQGLKDGGRYLFNFSVQNDHIMSSNCSVVDCRYDNRSENSNFEQTIVKDDDDLYVDLTLENIWPFGTTLCIRIRGENITPYDFFSVPQHLTQEAWDEICPMMGKIARSIRISEASQSVTETSKKTSKRKSPAKNKIQDANCIMDGTTLIKYIGTDHHIVLPDGITEIADETFFGTKIKSIVIPEGVKKIGRGVFENCFELEDVWLPTTLQELGARCFLDCHKLRHLDLGKKLTTIGESTFSECCKLENVIIPPKVKFIGSFAFKNCRMFTELMIPDGVEHIGYDAFSYCTNMTDLYIPASVTNIQYNEWSTPFDECDVLTIHCASGSVAEAYCESHDISFVIDNNMHSRK